MLLRSVRRVGVAVAVAAEPGEDGLTFSAFSAGFSKAAVLIFIMG
jgi:hypothetical protein